METNGNFNDGWLEKKKGHYPGIYLISWHVWATGFALIFILLSSQILFSIISIEDVNQPTLSLILANFASFHFTGLATIFIVLFSLVPAGARLAEACLNRNALMPTIAKAFKATLFLVPTVTLLNILILTVMDKMNWPVSQDPMMAWLSTAPAYIVVILAFGAVVIAPVAEEFMFRLVLFKSIQQFWGTALANVSTSLIFAISHFKPEHILPLFLLAVVLQRSFNRSENILLPISIHSFFNGSMIILALIGRYALNST